MAEPVRVSHARNLKQPIFMRTVPFYQKVLIEREDVTSFLPFSSKFVDEVPNTLRMAFVSVIGEKSEDRSI